MTPGRFWATHAVFTREELAAALAQAGRERSPATLSSHLTRWQRQKRIVQVKRGLYVRQEENDGVVDFLAVASRMAPDAALGYHTALEAHGFAQSHFERLYFLTWTKTKALTFRDRRFVPVRPSSQLRRSKRPNAWVENLQRREVVVRVTTVERTLVDVLARPDLAGGLEEAWRSCSAIQGLDLHELESYVRALRSRVVAAKVGFYLERHKQTLAVPNTLLDRLEELGPATPVYMERARSGKVVTKWKLVVPNELLAGDWEAAA